MAPFILTTVLWGKSYDCSHFTDVVPEAQDFYEWGELGLLPAMLGHLFALAPTWCHGTFPGPWATRGQGRLGVTPQPPGPSLRRAGGTRRGASEQREDWPPP